MCLQKCFECLARWKLWIRPLFIFLYAVAALVLVPLFLVRSLEDGFNKHDQEILIGGIFVWIAIPLSLWEILQHVIHYTQPKLQKHVIRILWMVPIYAVNAEITIDLLGKRVLRERGNGDFRKPSARGERKEKEKRAQALEVLNVCFNDVVGHTKQRQQWLGLIYPEESVYVDSIRECYEAYVIYNFMKYLLNYLNMEMDLEASLELKPQVKHIFPLCCLPDWEMGREFVHICKHGILQYTVVRPLTTAISFICKVFDVYGDGQFKGNVAFPYLIAVNNVSQFIAMYCLVMFYKASLAELRPMKPLPKFLCIKAVVFFSFFQSVVIDLLVYLDIITPNSRSSDDGLTLSTRLQDFLICIEMCLAAIAHHYSFSYEPYARPGSNNQSCCRAFLAMWDVSDVQTDIREHLGIVSSSISRRIRGRSMYTIPRGNDEYSNLVSPRGAQSVPNPGFYQNNSDEIVVNYGTVHCNQPDKIHNSRINS